METIGWRPRDEPPAVHQGGESEKPVPSMQRTPASLAEIDEVVKLRVFSRPEVSALHELEKAYENGFAAGQQHQARVEKGDIARRASEDSDLPNVHQMDPRRPIGTQPYGAYAGAAQARIAPPATDGMPPVQSQLRTTSMLLNALEESVTNLESAAGFVLQPEPPAGTSGAANASTRGLSQGACAIEQINTLLDREVSRIRSIIRRLEV